MLNKDAKLNPEVLDGAEMKSIRQGFGEGLLEAAKKDERIIGLSADLSESTCMRYFAKEFPERFFDVGVAEQNLAAVASGLAASGKIPFISSFGIFSPGRNWEHIRTTICYNNVPVKIVGSHVGLSASSDGGSHQMLEDIALTRVLPRMTVFSPCDSVEAKKATEEAAKIDGPVYIRLCREKTQIITTGETPFEVGKANIFWKPESGKVSLGIAVTGHLVFRAIKAAKELEKEGVAVSVLNFSTIKPLDEEALVSLAEETGAIVTLEEHQIAGGFGSAVAEILANQFPTPIEFVGVRDSFGQSGSYSELISRYGLDKESIKKAAKKVLKRKL